MGFLFQLNSTFQIAITNVCSPIYHLSFRQVGSFRKFVNLSMSGKRVLLCTREECMLEHVGECDNPVCGRISKPTLCSIIQFVKISVCHLVNLFAI